MHLHKTIHDYAEKNGVLIGICSAAGLPPLLKTAQSVIVVGVGYGKQESFVTDNIPRGRLASYAIGIDYHIKVRNLLAELVNYLRDTGVTFDSYIHVDSGPLPERRLALKAGIGYLGRNGCIISKKFGSFFNIGCVLTSINLEPYSLINSFDIKCSNCTACITNCPSGALTETGYDYTKCVSHITQKRGELSNWEQTIIGSHLFGCDACQSVCPQNTGKHICQINDINEIMPPLSEIFSMTKSTFKVKYGNTAIHWRGLSTIKRNASAIMNNYYKKGDT